MKSRFTLGILLVFLSVFSLNAKHILGGSAAYKVSNQNELNSTIDCEFNMFKDNSGGGANFDNNASFGIYGVKNNEYTFLYEVQSGFEDVQTIEQLNPGDCPLFDYSSATYKFSATLPNSTYDYYVISYQRCCRAGAVSNIMNPDESGFALSITIYPIAFSYPEKANALSASSIPFLLSSQNESTIDLDLDDMYTKEYMLTTPVSAGGVAGVSFGDPEACDGITPNPINCPPPFGNVEYVDQDNPYGIDSEVNIDKELGELSIHIPTNGITLFEMTVNRYVDGILLSRINNQWTTITSMCTFGPLSVSEDPDCNEARLAPNPSSNSIFSTCLLTDITIIDALGRNVRTIEKMESQEEISIVDLSTGVYRLSGTNQNGDLIKLQFVKSH